LIEHAFKHCARDLAFFDERIEKGLRAKLEAVAKAEFAVIEYTKAIEALKASGKAFQYPWNGQRPADRARALADRGVLQAPGLRDRLPASFKPFYMYCNDDGKTVACMDLLVPRVGELIGGSQREHRLDILESRMRETGLNPEQYRWYGDLRAMGRAARGLWAGLREAADVRDGHGEHPRRLVVPARAGQREILRRPP